MSSAKSICALLLWILFAYINLWLISFIILTWWYGCSISSSIISGVYLNCSLWAQLPTFAFFIISYIIDPLSIITQIVTVFTIFSFWLFGFFLVWCYVQSIIFLRHTYSLNRLKSEWWVYLLCFISSIWWVIILWISFITMDIYEWRWWTYGLLLTASPLFLIRAWKELFAGFKKDKAILKKTEDIQITSHDISIDNNLDHSQHHKKTSFMYTASDILRSIISMLSICVWIALLYRDQYRAANVNPNVTWVVWYSMWWWYIIWLWLLIIATILISAYTRSNK